jgi:hypothetical protein
MATVSRNTVTPTARTLQRMAEILHQRDHSEHQHSLHDPQEMQAQSEIEEREAGEDSHSSEGEAAEFTAIEQSEEEDMGYYLLDCHGGEDGSFRFAVAEQAESESGDSDDDTDEATSHTAVAMRLLQSMEADYAAVLRASSSSAQPSSASEQPATVQPDAEAQPDEHDEYDDDETDSDTSVTAAKAPAAAVEPMSAAKVQRIKLLMSKMELTAAIAPAAPSWAVDLQWQNGDVDTALSCLVASATMQQRAAVAAAPLKQHRK